MHFDAAGRARAVAVAAVAVGVAIAVGSVVNRGRGATSDPIGAPDPAAAPVSSGGPTPAQPTVDPRYASVKRISLEAAHARFQKGDALFVDVRSNLLYKGQHIPGAISIPYAEAADRVAELPPDRDIIVYCACHSAQESARAALAWADLGRTNVWVMWDGLNPWRAAGYPLEPPPKKRTAAPSP